MNDSLTKKIIRLSTLFVATTLFVACSSICGEETKCESYGDVVVCQFNLRYPGKTDGPKEDGSCVWEKRFPLVRDFLRYNEVDICGTQELFQGQINDMATMEEYGITGTATTVGKAGCHNNVILYRKDRFELLQEGVFWFSETPDVESSGWDAAKRKRNTNWAKFRDKKTGKEFHFFSSHFDHLGKVAKVESAKLLVKKIKEIAGDGAFFTMGDYNSNPESAAIAEIKKCDFMKNAREISQTAPYGPAFTNNYGYTGKGRNEIDWIDYIYVSPNVDVLKFAVISEIINGVHLSDHYPLLIKAKIN